MTKRVGFPDRPNFGCGGDVGVSTVCVLRMDRPSRVSGGTVEAVSVNQLVAAECVGLQ